MICRRGECPPRALSLAASHVRLGLAGVEHLLELGQRLLADLGAPLLLQEDDERLELLVLEMGLDVGRLVLLDGEEAGQVGHAPAPEVARQVVARLDRQVRLEDFCDEGERDA